MTDINVREYNSKAWDKAVERGSEWTIPVSPQAIENARAGIWEIVLTPEKSVPRAWFPVDMQGVDLLCLAGGGGQQGPILAAAGANVTVIDNSPQQLERDQFVAEREDLAIRLVQGDMRDLSHFDDGLRPGRPSMLQPLCAQRAAGLAGSGARFAPRRHAACRFQQPGELHLRSDRWPMRACSKSAIPCPTPIWSA